MNFAVTFLVLMVASLVIFLALRLEKRSGKKDTKQFDNKIETPASANENEKASFENKVETAVSGKGFTVLPMFNMVCKPFSFEEQGVLYNNKTMIPYSSISELELIVTPKDPLECGMMFVHSEGKIFKVGYTFKEREKFIHAYKAAYAKLGKKSDEKYWLLAHTGSYVKVYEDHILLRHMVPGTQVISGSTSGQKRIQIDEITSVQMKEPENLTVGFIQFSYAGSMEVRGNVIQAINDENSVPVSADNVPLAKEIVDYIYAQKKVLKNNSGVQVQNFSAADELKKFKELLDNGIITQEEFDTKKKQLLGL